MHFMQHKILKLTFVAFFFVCCVCVPFGVLHASSTHDATKIEIVMTVSTGTSDINITGTLDNSNPTVRDFIASLPRTMTMTRWDDREYYGKVGTPLSNAAPQQSGYADGDIAYFVPGGSFAVFFAKGGKSPISNLIVMGKVTSDLKSFQTLEKVVEMRIAIAE